MRHKIFLFSLIAAGAFVAASAVPAQAQKYNLTLSGASPGGLWSRIGGGIDAAIAKAVEGNRLSDISHTIERTATDAGFSIVKEFVGHGVGRSMHEDPQIPNYGPPGRGPRLEKGMTLAIEPMINLGSSKVEVLDDGWTVLTKDRKPSAHVEHTVLVGKNSPEILTCKEMSG